MKAKRRDFLKMTGLAGLGILGKGAFASDLETGNTSKNDAAEQAKDFQKKHKQRFNMAGFAAPKIETVRIGVIGLGQRGPAHAATMSRIEGVEIKALCDLRPERAEALKKQLEGSGHKPEIYAGSPDEWKKLCERKDIDLVIVTTPYYMHATMAIYAMEHGKHVLSEVPAAGTIEECWKLVETAERTQRHMMMLENYAYMTFQLLTLNMARQGFFGEVAHCDCAYNTSKMGNNFNKNLYWDMWWLKLYGNRKGNIYPTHGLGPVCQILDINRGDKLNFLVSVDSADFMMAARAKELAEKDEFFKPFVGQDYRGTVNTTIIKTARGRTIMLQHDASTPSPHNLFHGIYGTKGCALLDPQPPKIGAGNHEWVSAEEFARLQEKYTPALSRKMGELAASSGHGGSDLLIDWHVIDCLHNGLPLDQDVYDAAAWSSIVPLSQWSVMNNSNSIEIPDFTAGAWKTNKRNMFIELENGGNTKIIA